MKLDVAEETLIGNRIAVSMAGIFRTPLPIPSNAEIRPAPYITRRCYEHRRIPDQSRLRRATMATTKASGLRRMTQHPPKAPAFETRERTSRCVRAFGVTADRNHAFGQVIALVAWVKRLGLFQGEFPGRFAKTCRPSIEEPGAWAIFEITENLYRRADEDWPRFVRMLRHLENKFKDPNDVLLEAKHLKQKLQAKQESTAKKRAGKEQAL
jgi:hypothetical protein